MVPYSSSSLSGLPSISRTYRTSRISRISSSYRLYIKKITKTIENQKQKVHEYTQDYTFTLCSGGDIAA